MIGRAILRTTFWLSVGDAATLVAFAVVAIVVARRLGAAALGDYSMAMTIGALLQIVADAGYNMWLTRTVARQPERIGAVLAEAIGTKAVLWCATLPLALAVAAAHSSTALALTVVVALDVLASCIGFAVLAALRGVERYVAPQLISSGYSLVAAVAMVAAIVLCDSLVLAVVLMTAIGTGRALHLLARFRAETGEHLHSEHLAASLRLRNVAAQLGQQWRLWLVNIASSIVHRVPLVVLGLRGGSAEVGYFSAAFRIYSAARIVPGALFNVALPRLAADGSTAVVRSIAVAGAALGIGIAAAMWIAAEPIVRITFALDAAIEPLQFFALAFVGLSLKTTLEALLIGRRRDRLVAGAVTLGAIVSVVVALLLPPTATMFSLLHVAIEWLLFIVLAVWLVRWRLR